MTAFHRGVENRWGISLSGYPDLYRWSIDNIEKFWSSVWSFTGIVASREASTIVVDGELMPGAKWFPGARLNFAENLLRRRDEAPAIVFLDETGKRRYLTFEQLYDQVSRLVVGLRADGIQAGDRVVGFMPNIPETVVAMLAAASLGAAWSSCSPDFGTRGVLERFGQIAPKVLFAADGYFYNGKEIDCLERVSEILSELPGLRRTVITPYRRGQPELGGLRDAVTFAEYLTTSTGGEIDFAQLPFDHPLYILYSSGTTGAPKCIVHGAGGTLIQHLKEHQLHTDLKPGDALFYFTTCGWMMWNWLVSGLASGARIVLYEGSPMVAGGEVLFDLAEREGITVFGTSPKFLSTVAKEGMTPRDSHDLSRIRTVLSTGSPLAPELFDFVNGEVAPGARLSSIGGGTDIISCFALGNPIAPVWRGELQTRGLGMKVEVFDNDGRSLRGEKGELVCTKPFPSMPIGFWNDPDDATYRATYFARFPNAWHHGDYVELSAHDGIVYHGRSDAVLNPGGVRIGTSEIYREVEMIDEVVDSVVVGQDWKDDTRVVLFVKLRPGLSLDEALTKRVRKRIRDNTTPRHVPAKIIQIDDVPRTISGKVVELAVRKVIHGRAVENTDALANPESLDQFRDLPELMT